jgi:hypothetical protein
MRFFASLKRLFARPGAPAKVRPDFARLDAETETLIQDIREATDKAEAVECSQAIAAAWRAELRRVTRG